MEIGQTLHQKRNYKRYFWGRMISSTGDALQEIAILMIIAVYADSVAISGMIVTINALIRILSSAAVIQIRFRRNVKNTLVSLNCIYGLITLIFYMFYKLNDNMPYPIIVSYEALCSLIYTFYKIYQDMLMKTVCKSNENVSRLIAADNLINVVISFVGTALLIVCSVDVFLLFNAVSFFASAGFVSGVNVENDFISQINVRKKQNIIKRIILFRKIYPLVTSVIIISGGISFFYASYNLVVLAAIKGFSINKIYIGLFRGVFYISSIVLSYMAGYLDTAYIKRYIRLCLLIGVIGLGATPFLSGVGFLGVISVVYAVFGGGFNTLCQIFFQNMVHQGDIPLLKGLYNLICGGAIMIAGFVLPKVLGGGLLLFLFFMIALLAGGMLYTAVWD